MVDASLNQLFIQIMFIFLCHLGLRKEFELDSRYQDLSLKVDVINGDARQEHDLMYDDDDDTDDLYDDDDDTDDDDDEGDDDSKGAGDDDDDDVYDDLYDDVIVHSMFNR